MERKSLRCLLVTILSVLLTIAICSSLVEAQQTPPVYIVKKGDTLWDISRHYFENPFLWPNLWKKNKHIKDPQWIYPGQPLLLKERKIVPGQIDRSKRPVVKVMSTPHPVAKPPTPPKYITNRDQIDSCAYILSEAELKKQEKQWGNIIDAEQDKISYSYPDLVYINRGKKEVSPGEMFTVLRGEDMIFHPETGQKIGYSIHILGIIKVRKVFDKIALAKITKSFSEIRLHDRIKPYQQMPLPVRSEPKAEIQGVLIGSLDGRLNLATNNIVFLDLGQKQQIQPGNYFPIFRKDSIIDESIKTTQSVTVDDIIGELIILRAEKNTSTALITKSKDPILVGYQFSAQPRKGLE